MNSQERREEKRTEQNRREEKRRDYRPSSLNKGAAQALQSSLCHNKAFQTALIYAWNVEEYFLISYDINFENGLEDQLNTSVISLYPSGKRVKKDKFCNRTSQIPQQNTDICNKKQMLHNSGFSAFNRSDPIKAPYNNPTRKRNLHIPLKKISKSGHKLHSTNILYDNNAEVYILCKIVKVPFPQAKYLFT